MFVAVSRRCHSDYTIIVEVTFAEESVRLFAPSTRSCELLAGDVISMFKHLFEPPICPATRSGLQTE